MDAMKIQSLIEMEMMSPSLADIDYEMPEICIPHSRAAIYNALFDNYPDEVADEYLTANNGQLFEMMVARYEENNGSTDEDALKAVQKTLSALVVA